MEGTLREPSLSEVCLDKLLLSPCQLQQCLGLLPVSIHSLLLARAASLVAKPNATPVQEAIILLVSNWPKQRLNISDIVPGAKMKTEQFESHTLSLLHILMAGFLSLKQTSKLTTVDFSGCPQPAIFQLPLLSLPLEERCPRRIASLMKQKCYDAIGSGDGEFEEGNLETVLSWKLEELTEKVGQHNFEAKGPVDVYTECQVDLSDWVSMHTEILGLVLHDMTPFHLKVTQLTVNNFHEGQTRHLHWLLSMLDAQVLQKLVIYGKRKSINLLMWNLSHVMKRLIGLKKFGLGTSGPKMKLLGESDPEPEELLKNSLEILRCWPNLSELYFIGLTMTCEVEQWLEAVCHPLEKFILYACTISHADLEYLGQSSHLSALQELGMEHTNLRGMGSLLCEIIQNAPKLTLLNLKDSQLQLHQKTDILYALQTRQIIETLLLFDNEDRLSTAGYEVVTELACAITSLKSFYIFPFNYRPFEVFYRESVEQTCQALLLKNKRTDLILHY